MSNFLNDNYNPIQPREPVKAEVANRFSTEIKNNVEKLDEIIKSKIENIINIFNKNIENFDNNKTYYFGDVVVYDNKLYKLIENEYQGEFDNNKFVEITINIYNDDIDNSSGSSSINVLEADDCNNISLDYSEAGTIYFYKNCNLIYISKCYIDDNDNEVIEYEKIDLNFKIVDSGNDLYFIDYNNFNNKNVILVEDRINSYNKTAVLKINDNKIDGNGSIFSTYGYNFDTVKTKIQNAFFYIPSGIEYFVEIKPLSKDLNESSLFLMDSRKQIKEKEINITNNSDYYLGNYFNEPYGNTTLYYYLYNYKTYINITEEITSFNNFILDLNISNFNLFLDDGYNNRSDKYKNRSIIFEIYFNYFTYTETTNNLNLVLDFEGNSSDLDNLIIKTNNYLYGYRYLEVNNINFNLPAVGKYKFKLQKTNNKFIFTML